MESLFIASIVEGHGEVRAVPALIYRVQRAVSKAPRPDINRPIRVPSGSLRDNAMEFKRHVTLAAGRAAARKGVLLIISDSDDDCPAELGPRLLADAQAIRPDVTMFVGLAVREFESWFIAAAESLRGVAGLATDATAPSYFEDIRNAKGWLAQHMADGYDPIQHQETFTRAMNLDQARRARSFRRVHDFLRGAFETARDRQPR